MANRMGQAARFAYDPKVLLGYLDVHTEHRQTNNQHWHHAALADKVTARTQKYINGYPVDDAIQGRIMRRWRSEVTGVTLGAADRMLMCYDLTLDQFEDWASDNGLAPVLWDNRR